MKYETPFLTLLFTLHPKSLELYLIKLKSKFYKALSAFFIWALLLSSRQFRRVCALKHFIRSSLSFL